VLFAGWGLPGLVNALNLPTRFFLVSGDGGRPREVLSDVVKGVGGRTSVAWHPDGRLSVFLNFVGPNGWLFSTVSTDGTHRTDSDVMPKVLDANKEARLENWGQDIELAWSPAGDAIYCRSWSNHVQNLWKFDVDPATLRWIGGPHRLTTGPGADANVALSPDGKRLAFTTEVHTQRVWSFRLDPTTGRTDGPGAPVTSTELNAFNADVSRDGRTLVFEGERTGTQGHRHQVWSKDLEDGGERLLRTHYMDNPDQFVVTMPHVSPDGRLIAWSRQGPSVHPLIFDTATGEERPVTTSRQPGLDIVYGWSADAKWLVATGRKYTPGLWGLWLLPVAHAPRAEEHVRIVTSSPDYSMWEAGLSPDGQWIAFEAVPREFTTATLFAVRASGGPWLQLTEGRFWDDKPRWSGDGRYVYFVSSRDGLLNVWALPFDGVEGRPGEPFKVTRFDDPRTMIFPSIGPMEIGVGERRLVVPVLEFSSGIWMLEGVNQ
jgi:Tol biopolymer transport system component